MLGIVRKINLNIAQKKIKKNYPGVNMVLHKEMPISSMSDMPRLAAIVNKVNSFEEKLKQLSDMQLREKTSQFKDYLIKKSEEINPQIAELNNKLEAVTIQEEKDSIKEKIKLTRNKVFEEILPEAFAVVREASMRTIGLRHFDVQIAGGVILHEGKIPEMSTGEGKTLVATLPAYLNALLGKGVHIVTVNDYLAKRDSEWMGPIFNFFGLSVGVIQHELSDQQRKVAYGCDITYGTNNEFGFDYLRDNMKYSVEDLVQRDHFYAIVDEVDSILIDESRTPLIISGAAEESTDKYYTAKGIAEKLKGRRITENDEIDAKHKGEDLSIGFDYVADEKAQTISLSEEGEKKAAKYWGVEDLHSFETMELKHHINQALRAKEFFRVDKDYIVKDNQVIIVDEFTGRLMPGRRWSDGLHQAIESKEGMKIERENQTLATITFQNYFRMYEKLAGMTGTAYTESSEFKAIYRLEVVTLPTNRPLIRENFADCIYRTEKEKFDAVVKEISELYHKGKPVLVGTISIEKSELLSELLKRKGVQHQVLNAKYHEMEAQIVAQAGRYKGVTIATNMAGRGTDILLGGNPDFLAKSLMTQKLNSGDSNFDYEEEFSKVKEKFKAQTKEEHNKVVEIGGLHVLGTERHESRRIDNQLRGRCGRQGDPGASRFYISLEDDLMRLFGSDKLRAIMSTLGFEEGQVIEHPLVSRSLEVAQKKVEQHNFEIRKQLLEYDNVMNKQREVIYGQRRQILEGCNLKEQIYFIVEKITAAFVEEFFRQEQEESKSSDEEKLKQLITSVGMKFGVSLTNVDIDNKNREELKKCLYDTVVAFYEEKEKRIGTDLSRHMERMVFLQIMDSKWKDHLYAMDKLREGIGLRAYGHRDPLIEYKKEAFFCFSLMMDSIDDESVEMIYKLAPVKEERVKTVFHADNQQMLHPEVKSSAHKEAQHSLNQPQQVKTQINSANDKVGRNDSCPCGSGKKYKKCCGNNA